MKEETTKHTPESWELKPVGDLDFRKPSYRDRAIVGGNGICIGIIWGSFPGEFDGSQSEMDAYANLIVSSPDMLAALKEARQEIEQLHKSYSDLFLESGGIYTNGIPENETAKAIDTVIKKATGQ